MADEFVVKSAIEYLQRRFASGEPADLVGMLNHVDYYVRVVMIRDEIQEVLKRCPGVCVQRLDGRIIFMQADGDCEIGEQDLQRNVQMHNDQFWASYRRMQSSVQRQ